MMRTVEVNPSDIHSTGKADTEHRGRRVRRSLAWGLLALALCACSSTQFVATWKAPGVAPIDPRGSKVVAVVMVQNETGRRAAEDRLAYEISTRGAQGIAMYRLMPEPGDEAKVRERLASENVLGVVVLRPIRVEREWVVTPSTYGDPYYRGYWGGYHGYGWGHPYGAEPVDVHSNQVVSIETLVYSLKENKLIWGGQSKTTNPQDVDELVTEVAEAAAKELEYQGVIVRP
ncbi:MAG TPA: hypothetical protein VNN80_27050 [Polyangiaceae bacterium]|nr:hypothetical protein [Polyangiaceae bacterium]